MHLKIMEWNVQDFFLQLDFPLRPEELEALSDEQWQLLGKSDVYIKPLAKIKMIAAIIRETDPDVVCFCELGGYESLALFAQVFLDDLYEAHLLEGNSNRGIESGFLVKKGKGFTARLQGHKDWPVPFAYPHEKDPVTYRLAAEAAQYYDLGTPQQRKLSRDIPALFLERDGRTRLVILLVHLKSGFDTAGVDPEGRVRRAAELKALLAIEKDLKAKLGPTVPVILTGDFNGKAGRRETAPEFEALYRETEFEDVLELKSIPHYERISQLTFIRSQVIAQQLDFIFLPKALQSRLIEAFVYRFRFNEDQKEIMLPSSFRDRARLPSDHYPLVCIIDLEDYPGAPPS